MDEDDLRKRVEQLERALFGEEVPGAKAQDLVEAATARWHLSRRQMALLVGLVESNLLETDEIIRRIYPKRQRNRDKAVSALRVMVLNLRRRLRPDGIAVRNRWSIGYYITQQDKARMLHLLDLD